jgi:hypothetical protein
MTEFTLSQRAHQIARQGPRAFLLLAALVWCVLYQSLMPASEGRVNALPVDRASQLGGAIQFFFYDMPKVLLLLPAVVFVMGMIYSYFTPEREPEQRQPRGELVVCRTQALFRDDLGHESPVGVVPDHFHAGQPTDHSRPKA